MSIRCIRRLVLTAMCISLFFAGFFTSFSINQSYLNKKDKIIKEKDKLIDTHIKEKEELIKSSNENNKKLQDKLEACKSELSKKNK